MTRQLLLLALCIAACTQSLPQKNKNKKETTSLAFDSTTFLSEFSKRACTCIDSVDKAEKDKDKKLAGFSACIDNEVGAYQLAVKLLGSMASQNKNTTITLGEKNTDDYKHYYYDIERWLKDSCAVLNRAISTNDKANDKSYSDNKDAMDAYDKGVGLLKTENYEQATPFFEKAVAIDPGFAFAWDNLGVCYRRTNKYEKAEMAYKSSLKVDPTGKTALQNLPVVYLLLKREDDAITAYNDMLHYYPNDPEVYYGIGLVYFNSKKDLEKALDNICKAYNIYVEQKSPYRSDAEKAINMIYGILKKDNKEDVFNRILKENNIKTF
jgi:tetratricopeptide (TPR) repeat protein